VTAAFVGCIGTETDDVVESQSADPTDAVDSPEDVERFAPGDNATEIPDPDSLGQPVTNLTGYSGAEPTMGTTESGAMFATAND